MAEQGAAYTTRMTSLPLVLLPGLLCDACLWRDPAAALADVAPVHHADLTLDDSVAGMAARVLAAAPPVFALAGLSTGGYVAFWWTVAILLFALPFLVGWAVAKLSGKTLAIVGAILAAFFIAILIMGQLFVF